MNIEFEVLFSLYNYADDNIIGIAHSCIYVYIPISQLYKYT